MCVLNAGFWLQMLLALEAKNGIQRIRFGQPLSPSTTQLIYIFVFQFQAMFLNIE